MRKNKFVVLISVIIMIIILVGVFIYLNLGQQIEYSVETPEQAFTLSKVGNTISLQYPVSNPALGTILICNDQSGCIWQHTKANVTTKIVIKNKSFLPKMNYIRIKVLEKLIDDNSLITEYDSAYNMAS